MPGSLVARAKLGHAARMLPQTGQRNVCAPSASRNAGKLNLAGSICIAVISLLSWAMTAAGRAA
jgi:hypothetical protein